MPQENAGFQWTQGTKRGQQDDVAQAAIASTSPYGLVRSLLWQDYERNMKRSGGRFDQAMKQAGLGATVNKNAMSTRFGVEE